MKRDGDDSSEQRSKRARIHSENTAAAEASEAGLANHDHPVGATSRYLSDDDERAFRASPHAVPDAIKASSDGLETLINSDPSFGGLPSQRRLLNLVDSPSRCGLGLTALAYPREPAMTELQVPIFLPPDVDAPANFLAFLDPAKLEIRLFIPLADGQPGTGGETNSLGQARARYWTSILFNGRGGLDPAIMAADVLKNLIHAETKVTLEVVVKGPAPNKNDIARQKAHEGLSLPVGFRPAPGQLAKSKPATEEKTRQLSDNGLDPLAACNVVMQVDPPYEVIVGEGNISLGNVDTLARPPPPPLVPDRTYTGLKLAAYTNRQKRLRGLEEGMQLGRDEISKGHSLVS
ncbi:hypothetical protein JCM21900_005909 [Sporobolomyces salmonicolor]